MSDVMPRLRSSIRATAILFVLAAASACGDSPTSPSVNLSGTWTGTWRFQTAGVTVTDDITATLTQSGTSAAGDWTAQSGPTGQLTIAVGDSISGTLTISQTMFTGQVCTGTTTIVGSATSSTLELAAAQVPSSGVCQWAAEMRFSLRK